MYITILYFIWGLILGSLINVIIYRLPNNLSIVNPRSFCPKCKFSIPLYRNIPIISYIIQMGICSNCNNRISKIYPIIELSIGLVWFIGAISFSQAIDIIYFSTVASFLICISIIDYRHFIIPLEISTFCFLFITTSLIINGKFVNHLDGLLIGTGYLSIILLFTWLITKRQALGFGDIQLAVVLGFWFGDIRILLVIFLSAFIALITWVLISFTDKFDKNRPLPFGSFLSIVSIFIYLLDLSQFSFLL